MRVKSLMNKIKDKHVQNFIEGQKVNYGDIVTVSKEYTKMKTFKTMINFNLIEIVPEEKKTKK